jgi:UDP-glucose 4-epimerase
VSRALAWVIGRGGLLGSHTARRLAASSADYSLWAAEPEFVWTEPELVRRQIDQALTGFFSAVQRGGHQAWTIFWVAGAGVVGTTVEALAAETAVFAHTLERIAAQRPGPPVAGSVFLASSAGGVYGRCPDSPATESSLCVPISDYGRAKLEQEGLLMSWAEAHAVSALVGRISNLYGPGQNLDKPQGLVTHLVRSLVLNRPVHLYVPLDTLRDYFHADDCAAAILRAAARLARESRAAGAPRSLLKIFGAEQPASISALLGIVSRVTRRRPLIIHAAPRALTAQQPRSLTFRTTVWRDEHWQGTISLPVGVAQVHRDLVRLFREGRLVDRLQTR